MDANDNSFKVFFNKYSRLIIIVIITIILHIAVLIFIPVAAVQSQKRKDNTIFKIVDIQEYKQPEEKIEDKIEITKQEKVVEDVIETDKEVKELDIDYLPQHKISEAPDFPHKLIKSKIVYPSLANKQGIEGIVYLELYIDNVGNIKKIVVLKDPGYGFADAAINALKGIKVKPAKSNGIPVAVRYRLPIRFTLK